MSGAGAPKLQIDASDLQVAIVVTSWHTNITDGLLAGAERALKAAGNSEYEIWRVPGAFELPLGAQYAIDAGADVVIALGVVIQGDTPHFDYVCSAATDGLNRVHGLNSRFLRSMATIWLPAARPNTNKSSNEFVPKRFAP